MFFEVMIDFETDCILARFAPIEEAMEFIQF